MPKPGKCLKGGGRGKQKKKEKEVGNREKRKNTSFSPVANTCSATAKATTSPFWRARHSCMRMSSDLPVWPMYVRGHSAHRML